MYRQSTQWVNLRTGYWEEGSRYEFRTDAHYFTTQGGRIHEVRDRNNLGETVGRVYEDAAATDPVTWELVYTHQLQFEALNGTIGLDFEPLAIADTGTILGRTPGPAFGMVILDSFGQRPLGPVIPELQDQLPLLSNPAGGFEEIVMGNRYWRRMSERNLQGTPTGSPSPDFWEGSILDLVPEPGNWEDLRATCLSAGGRIAGIGQWRNPATGAPEERAFLLMPSALLPDWDRSGIIDAEDVRLAAQAGPWRFWINDDDDAGEESRSSLDDLPGSPNPDLASPGMDGIRDAVDFFPVLVDLRSVLQGVQQLDSVQVTLQQQDGALNLLYSDLHPREAGLLGRDWPDSGFGPGFNLAPEEAPVHPVGPDPLPLSLDFLRNLRDANRGVLFFEATGPTTEPLVLEIQRNGQPIFRDTLPLSVRPVREMFRILNLREVDPKFSGAGTGPWETALEDPANLPDAWLARLHPPLRTIVHLHGFNWSEEEVPAAHAELFKRFYQSGSPARFIGVSWFGDQGKSDLLGTAVDYNENVLNALLTAYHLPAFLEPFSGPGMAVFAHSLGSLVAASALGDFELQTGALFLLNAALPVGAFLGDHADRRQMVHPDWKDTGGALPDHAEFLMAANWHRLFPADDNRSGIRWKEGFRGLVDRLQCWNFHSSGEDVLAPGTGDLPALFGDVWDQERVWVYNEMVKGTTALAASLTADVHGGWGFNRHYMRWVDPGGAAHPPPGYWQPMPTAESLKLTPEACVEEPFFRKFSSSDPGFPGWGDGTWLYGESGPANDHLPDRTGVPTDRSRWINLAKLLAEAIPAHSPAAGASAMPNLPLLSNIDLDSFYRDPANWPLRADAEKRNRWLHSDYLRLALPFVGRLYRACAEALKDLP